MDFDSNGLAISQPDVNVKAEAWRENAATDAYIPMGDVTRVMVWHKDGRRVGLLLARLDGRYSNPDSDRLIPVVWAGVHSGKAEWVSVDAVSAIASMSDPSHQVLI